MIINPSPPYTDSGDYPAITGLSATLAYTITRNFGGNLFYWSIPFEML